ncbi:hypothetical protein HS088_TW15G00156 [Tripterygium wilfordii]|uniref:Uncharacterized protein n=1 Tax=Tripterygium wilfordii TaxID=458696 RepID=A0A7J7CKT2_TRIWF|nr:hypothetical protein HS088_TW15G00156 [Tripterygium wilfordii]
MAGLKREILSAPVGSFCLFLGSMICIRLSSEIKLNGFVRQPLFESSVGEIN